MATMKMPCAVGSGGVDLVGVGEYIRSGTATPQTITSNQMTGSNAYANFMLANIDTLNYSTMSISGYSNVYIYGAYYFNKDGTVTFSSRGSYGAWTDAIPSGTKYVLIYDAIPSGSGSTTVTFS